MLQNLVKFQKFQLDNLVDFEKCCKTHIFLQKSEPIQPKTSNILPKICQKLATTLRVAEADGLPVRPALLVRRQAVAALVEHHAEVADQLRLEDLRARQDFANMLPINFLARCGSFSSVSVPNFAIK